MWKRDWQKNGGQKNGVVKDGGGRPNALEETIATGVRPSLGAWIRRGLAWVGTGLRVSDYEMKWGGSLWCVTQGWYGLRRWHCDVRSGQLKGVW